MKKEVIITISGMQNYEGQEPDSVELVTSGTFEETPEGICLTYDETELTGMGSTTTTVKIEDDKVSIIRFGDASSHMIFQEEQKHISYYDMGFGAFTIGINTRRISRNFKKHEGSLEIEYCMEINNSMAGENSFCLTYRDA